MKQRNYVRLCFIVSAVLAAGFCLHLGWDWMKYSTTLNSAPFSLWVLANAVYFLLPAVIFLAAGLILHRRKKKNSKESPHS